VIVSLSLYRYTVQLHSVRMGRRFRLRADQVPLAVTIGASLDVTRPTITNWLFQAWTGAVIAAPALMTQHGARTLTSSARSTSTPVSCIPTRPARRQTAQLGLQGSERVMRHQTSQPTRSPNRFKEPRTVQRVKACRHESWRVTDVMQPVRADQRVIQAEHRRRDLRGAAGDAAEVTPALRKRRWRCDRPLVFPR